jgi:hypothetical protein
VDPIMLSIKQAIIDWAYSSLFQDCEIKTAVFEEEKSDERYRLALRFKNCIAEILVDKPYFAPYRYVSFQVYAVVNEKLDLAYYWYDQDGDQIDTILEQIGIGIQFSRYYPYSN